VIAIIGILSALIVVGMSSTTQKATIAKAQVFSNSLRNSLMDNLISEWKMDDGSGAVVADSWGGGNTGSISGFTDTTAGYGDTHNYGWMSSTNCVSGTCLKFDGANNYIGCGSGTNLQFGTGDFTISFWRKRLNAYRNYNGYVASSAAAAAYAGFFESVSGETFEMGNAGVFQSFSLTNLRTGSKINSFQHIVIMIDRDGKLDSYLDGIKKDSITITLSTSLSVGFSTLHIGHFWAGNSDGIIDDVQIFKAVIPASQIQQNYFAGINKLFTKNQINNYEYSERLAELANNYAKE